MILLDNIDKKLEGAFDSLKDLKKFLAELENVADNLIVDQDYIKYRNQVELHIQELHNQLNEIKNLTKDLKKAFKSQE